MSRARELANLLNSTGADDNAKIRGDLDLGYHTTAPNQEVLNFNANPDTGTVAVAIKNAAGAEASNGLLSYTTRNRWEFSGVFGASSLRLPNNATSSPVASSNANDEALHYGGQSEWSANGTPLVVNRRSAGNLCTWGKSGTFIGNVASTTSNTIVYGGTSDYRAKNVLGAAVNKLGLVNQIPVYRFEFKAAPGHEHTGCLAHELAAFIPGAVSGEKDAVDTDGNPEMQQVDYSHLVPTLLAAVQELSAQVEELKAA